MTRLQYINDNNGAFQETHGSDGRLNTSSRSDSRGYYNSRDDGQSYSVPFDDTDAADGDFVVYWQNTNTSGKHLVIEAIGVNVSSAAILKVHSVTGTASGTELTPSNLNLTSPNAATSKALGSNAVSGLTIATTIDCVNVQDYGHEEFRLSERLRLGQNDAIAIEYDRGQIDNPQNVINGVIFGYFE